MDKENNVPTVTEEKQTLDAIEESVKSLYVRIQYLLKEDSRNRKRLDETFQSSIKLIERKVEQTQHHQKMKQFTQISQKQSESVQFRVKQMREKQHGQITAVRESLCDMKKQQRDSIRQLSRRNQLVIEQSRKALLQKKKQTVQLLKQEKQQSRADMLKQLEERYTAYQHRKKDLLKAKQEQRKRNEQKRSRLTQELKEKEKMERQLVEKLRHTSQNLYHFSALVRATAEMKLEDFQAVLTEVSQKEKINFSKGQGIEKILEYILLNKNTSLQGNKQLAICSDQQPSKARDMRSTDRSRDLHNIYRKVGSNGRRPSKFEDSNASNDGSFCKSTNGQTKTEYRTCKEEPLQKLPEKATKEQNSEVAVRPEGPKQEMPEPSIVVIPPQTPTPH